MNLTLMSNMYPLYEIYIFKKKRTNEMIQWLKVPAAKA